MSNCMLILSTYRYRNLNFIPDSSPAYALLRNSQFSPQFCPVFFSLFLSLFSHLYLSISLLFYFLLALLFPHFYAPFVFSHPPPVCLFPSLSLCLSLSLSPSLSLPLS